MVKSTGNWQDIFVFATGLNRRFVWDLDCLSLKQTSDRMKNHFWKEVFIAWMKYKQIDETNIDVRSYPVWDTYFITNNNLLQIKNILVNRGLIYLNDILTDSGHFLGYEDFCQKFQVNITFIDFYSLTHSIPGNWKRSISMENTKLGSGSLMQKCMINILNKMSICQWVYWSFINSKQDTNKCMSNWNKVLSLDIPRTEWQELFSMNFKATLESKLRAFQYKILTRTLVTNSWLFKCKIITSDLCYFCKLEPETIEHLFWNCTHIQNLLTFIKNKLSPYIAWQTIFTCRNLILGTMEGDKVFLTNHVFMIIKRYIYITRCKEGFLNKQALLDYIHKNITLT